MKLGVAEFRLEKELMKGKSKFGFQTDSNET